MGSNHVQQGQPCPTESAMPNGVNHIPWGSTTAHGVNHVPWHPTMANRVNHIPCGSTTAHSIQLWPIGSTTSHSIPPHPTGQQCPIASITSNGLNHAQPNPNPSKWGQPYPMAQPCPTAPNHSVSPTSCLLPQRLRAAATTKSAPHP